MPLIDLKTDLKSLKFGKDRPGGGSSNQPYIQKQIPEGDPSNIFNTGGPDFLLRGGLIAPLKAADDTSRLTQMFFDLKSPNGLLFTTKENLLSRTAVKTEASFGPGYAAGTINAGVYTPLSTLGQAASGFTGTHLNLLGLDPSSPMAGVDDGGLFPGLGLNRYEDVVKKKSKEDNRLVGLYTQVDQNTSISNFAFQSGVELNNGVNILSYPGGPGSILGIGNTNIKFADQRTGKENPLATNNPTAFYTGSRWVDRTKDSWISPLTKGASGKYEDYIGGPGSLIFKDGDPIITADGGYTYNQNWDFNTTKSGSLDAREDVISGSYQVPQIKLVTPDYDKVITPKGVTGLYSALTSASIDTNLTDKFFFNVYDPSTTPGNTWPNNTPLQYANKSQTFTQQQILDYSNNLNSDFSSNLNPEDFRKQLIKDNEVTDFSTVLSLSPSYKTKNIGNRVNLGDPGRTNNDQGSKNVFNYGVKATDLTALDKITALPMYDGAGPDTSQAINDLVKFRIAAINNDKTDGSAVYMHFRAFIDSFGDSFTSNWDPIQYVGRGDKLYTYTGFDRQIQMSFTVYAQSKAELIPMYKKLNYLASTLAPDYTSAGFMRGNLVRLTMGGYLYEQPGFITSLNYEIPQESTWEIAINEEGKSDSSVKELPHMIRVQMSFTPIHTFLPQKPNVANNPDERYIALANAFYSRGNYADTYKSYQASSTADIPGEGTAV